MPAKGTKKGSCIYKYSEGCTPENCLGVRKCGVHSKLQSRDYRKTHPDKIKIYNKEAYKRHTKEVSLYMKIRHNQHKEEDNARSRKWGEKHAEEKRLYAKNWCNTHKEERKAYSRKWHEEHAEEESLRRKLLYEKTKILIGKRLYIYYNNECLGGYDSRPEAYWHLYRLIEHIPCIHHPKALSFVRHSGKQAKYTVDFNDGQLGLLEIKSPGIMAAYPVDAVKQNEAREILREQGIHVSMMNADDILEFIKSQGYTIYSDGDKDGDIQVFWIEKTGPNA